MRIETNVAKSWGTVLALVPAMLASYASLEGGQQAAQTAGTPMVTKAVAPRAETAGNAANGSHLRGTYFNSGNWDSGFFPGGNVANPVDNQLTVTCPGKSTCTIEADMFVEEGNAPSASGGGLCLDVDNGAQFECWGSNYSEPNIIRSFSQIITLTGFATGPHTVQTYLYSGSGTDVYQYFITYHVYTP
jgi:hypothetical protein